MKQDGCPLCAREHTYWNGDVFRARQAPPIRRRRPSDDASAVALEGAARVGHVVDRGRFPKIEKEQFLHRNPPLLVSTTIILYILH